MRVAHHALVAIAALRGVYGLRSSMAGFLHQFGAEGQLGYSVTVTRLLAETGLVLSLLSLAIQVGYFAIAWAVWGRSRWLIWIALAVYLTDQAMWISFSVRPEDVAVHGQERIDQHFDPDFLDWVLFTLETLIAAGAIALGLRAAPAKT